MRAILLAIAILGCKADDPAPAGAPPSKPSRAGSAVAMDKVMPVVDGAKVLKSGTPRDGYATIVWCIDQPDAVERVKAALAREGWADVHSRGKAEQLGIAATKGDARFSATVRTRDDHCAGTSVYATVILLGKIQTQLRPGEKLR